MLDPVFAAFGKKTATIPGGWWSSVFGFSSRGFLRGFLRVFAVVRVLIARFSAHCHASSRPPPPYPTATIRSAAKS